MRETWFVGQVLWRGAPGDLTQGFSESHLDPGSKLSDCTASSPRKIPHFY